MQPLALGVPAGGGASEDLQNQELAGVPRTSGWRASIRRRPRLLALNSALHRGTEATPAPDVSLPLRSPSPRTPGVTRAKKMQSRTAEPMPRRQPQRRGAFRDPRASCDSSGRARPSRRQLQAGEGGPLNRVWHHVLAWCAHLQAVWGRATRAGEGGLGSGGRGAESLTQSLALSLALSAEDFPEF